MGISFQYPDNWTLDEEDAMAGQESVTVYSPGGGFWCVTMHPRSAEPARLAQAAVDAMKQEYEQEYEQLEVAGAEKLAGRELLGFDLNFFYLDLTNTAAIRSFQTALATYTVFWQADDRELEKIGLVFQAMTTSLLQSL